MAESSYCGSFHCPVIVILGSTGTGKSKLGIELAEKVNGEIISADSMQVYTGLDIITNKVTEEEMKRCKHHLINLVSPTENFNVVDYRNVALPLILDLAKQGKVPIIVGGTNYYIEALIWDILMDGNSCHTEPKAASVESDLRILSTTIELDGQTPEVKNSEELLKGTAPLTSALGSKGTDPKQHDSSLYEELQRVDPGMASRIHPNNTRKVSRSLEVYKEHGRSHSTLLHEQKAKLNADFLGGPLRFKNVLVFWLTCDWDILTKRLSQRVDDMIKKGLLEEITNFYDRLKEAGFSSGESASNCQRGILQSIGFKEFQPYFDQQNYAAVDKEQVFEDCVKRLKLVTVRYAKKQAAWVRNRFLGRPSFSAPDIYELDASDVSNWSTKVLNKALEITQCFLSNSKIKHAPLPRITRHDHWNRHRLHTCDICHGRVIMGDQAWDSHCRSRAHRKLRAKRRRQVEKDSK